VSGANGDGDGDAPADNTAAARTAGRRDRLS
jgi:hypothetical protein